MSVTGLDPRKLDSDTSRVEGELKPTATPQAPPQPWNNVDELIAQLKANLPQAAGDLGKWNLFKTTKTVQPATHNQLYQLAFAWPDKNDQDDTFSKYVEIPASLCREGLSNPASRQVLVKEAEEFRCTNDSINLKECPFDKALRYFFYLHEKIKINANLPSDSISSNDKALRLEIFSHLLSEMIKNHASIDLLFVDALLEAGRQTPELLSRMQEDAFSVVLEGEPSQKVDICLWDLFAESKAVRSACLVKTLHLQGGAAQQFMSLYEPLKTKTELDFYKFSLEDKMDLLEAVQVLDLRNFKRRSLVYNIQFSWYCNRSHFDMPLAEFACRIGSREFFDHFSRRFDFTGMRNDWFPKSLEIVDILKMLKERGWIETVKIPPITEKHKEDIFDLSLVLLFRLYGVSVLGLVDEKKDVEDELREYGDPEQGFEELPYPCAAICKVHEVVFLLSRLMDQNGIDIMGIRERSFTTSYWKAIKTCVADKSCAELREEYDRFKEMVAVEDPACLDKISTKELPHFLHHFFGTVASQPEESRSINPLFSKALYERILLDLQEDSPHTTALMEFLNSYRALYYNVDFLDWEEAKAEITYSDNTGKTMSCALSLPILAASEEGLKIYRKGQIDAGDIAKPVDELIFAFMFWSRAFWKKGKKGDFSVEKENGLLKDGMFETLLWTFLNPSFLFKDFVFSIGRDEGDYQDGIRDGMYYMQWFLWNAMETLSPESRLEAARWAKEETNTELLRYCSKGMNLQSYTVEALLDLLKKSCELELSYFEVQDIVAELCRKWPHDLSRLPLAEFACSSQSVPLAEALIKNQWISCITMHNVHEREWYQNAALQCEVKLSTANFPQFHRFKEDVQMLKLLREAKLLKTIYIGISPDDAKLHIHYLLWLYYAASVLELKKMKTDIEKELSLYGSPEGSAEGMLSQASCYIPDDHNYDTRSSDQKWWSNKDELTEKLTPPQDNAKLHRPTVSEMLAFISEPSGHYAMVEILKLSTRSFTKPIWKTVQQFAANKTPDEVRAELVRLEGNNDLQVLELGT